MSSLTSLLDLVPPPERLQCSVWLQELEEVEAKLEQDEKGQSRWRRELSRFCTPVFLEAFVLTFLAEWGDRSQIATISLAAQHDP